MKISTIRRFLTLTLLMLLTLSSNAQEFPLRWSKGGFSAKIGGFIRVNTMFDVDGNIPLDDFIVSKMPKENDKFRSAFDASVSRVNLLLVQSTKQLGDIKAFIEADFRGVSNVFRLRQAYVSFLGLTIGQTWSIWTDMAANAPTVDIHGVGSRTFFRTPQISYNHRFGSHWSAAVSLEIPSQKFSEKAVSMIPNIPAYVQYSGKIGHLRAAGLVKFNDTEQPKSIGWGVQLSGTARVLKPISLFGQAVYGQGIPQYINDLQYFAGSDFFRNIEDYAIPVVGISLGIKADISKSVYAASSYSITTLKDQYNIFGNDHYKSGEYVSMSLFWVPLSNLTLGAEYLYGQLDFFKDSASHAGRVELMAMYYF